MDHGSPGSSVHSILQTRILKWVAVPPPGNLPDPGIEPASLLSPALAGRLFTTDTTWEAPWGRFRATEIQLGTPWLSAGCSPPSHAGTGSAGVAVPTAVYRHQGNSSHGHSVCFLRAPSQGLSHFPSSILLRKRVPMLL